MRWLAEPADVVRVHQAATEVEALAVEQALRSTGVRAWLRSRQLPGYGEVVARAWGIWGDVLVAPEDEVEARGIVDAYLASVREDGMTSTMQSEAPRQGVRRFAGILPPLVTLFNRDGSLDEAAMRRHVDRLLEGGVHGLFALGTTGEVMHLLPQERRRVAELVVEAAQGRVPVLIGCGSTSTDEATAHARHAQEIGASGVVVIVPYYWTLSDAAVEAHYAAIASAVDLPLIIYNFPAVSGRNFPAPLIARLAEAHPTIAGIKETIDSIGHIQQVLAAVRPKRPDFTVHCGYEYHLINTLLIGGDGSVPGMANLAPAATVAVYDAVRRGDVEGAAEMMQARLEFPSLYEFGAPLFVVVKEAMAMAGWIEAPTVRLPAQPLGEEARTRLRGLLERMGML
ncbi:MAG TPA: dihydrodipicolinate synthase family protein [bacterium]|jgi:4-hydroxy-tetrahydrodipicolinate synthase|nr:dihydrodipicolinate synthase family protein [bacterium]